jgi:hypothetical protein
LKESLNLSLVFSCCFSGSNIALRLHKNFKYPV